MKTKVVLLGSLLLIPGVWCAVLHSQPAPTFYAGVKIQYNNQDLRPQYSGSSTAYNYYSVPCVADWNGDGKKDLLVGCFYEGWIYLYTNSGVDNSPIFINEDLLKAGGSTISVGYG